MSQRLPVPLGSGRAEQPEVVVLTPGAGSSARANPLLRLALQMAPDVLRALDRSRSRAGQIAPVVTTPRNLVHGLSMSEVELDIRIPLVRRVVVRKATAWAADLPVVAPPPARGGRLRRAGMLGAGAFAAATIGLLANRANGLVGPGSRRG
ncbi:MAG TPA: hypothetical protein PKA95_13705 [Thermomicrobiales bacterium]|nr:hypothetical protein [Thermomicrobiales bacterium]